MKEFKSVLELTNYFTNERICVEYLEQQRWNGTPECPHCGSENHSRVQTRFKSEELKGYKDFRCKACDKKYSVLTGTIFESTKVSLKKWFMAMYLLINHKKGISSLQLAADLGITQKSAWHMSHRIRELFKEDAPEIIEDIVEVDETYVGGKNKNRHRDKKVKNSQGRSSKDKVPVVGLIERGKGKVYTFVVDNTEADTLQPIIQKHVSKDCTLITDAYKSYNGLEKAYNHVVVKHTENNYRTDSHFHTNNIEGFWSHLKRAIIGIYHRIGRKHLKRYCAEFAFRYNQRKLNTLERFELAFSKCHTRLSYKTLIQRI